MHQSQVTPEFLRTLGQAVLDFGFMESAIHNVVIVLSRESGLAKALVPSANRVSQNLDLLRRLCRYRVDAQVLDPWLEAIDPPTIKKLRLLMVVLRHKRPTLTA